jgi:hypothetical protein
MARNEQRPRRPVCLPPQPSQFNVLSGFGLKMAKALLAKAFEQLFLTVVSVDIGWELLQPKIEGRFDCLPWLVRPMKNVIRHSKQAPQAIVHIVGRLHLPRIINIVSRHRQGFSVSDSGVFSFFSPIKSVDQAADHLGDDFKTLSERHGRCFLYKPAPAGDFDQRNAFLCRTASDGEEVATVRLGEAAISLGEVGGDRKGRSVQLVDKEAIAARKAFGHGGDLVGEVHGFLVDFELLEHESHERFPVPD